VGDKGGGVPPDILTTKKIDEGSSADTLTQSLNYNTIKHQNFWGEDMR